MTDSPTTNPYAPPQTVEAKTRSHGREIAAITALSLVLMTVWGIFSGFFCFIGRYVAGVDGDLFGFGGMGLCVVGLPIIAALTIRPTQDYSSLKACCLLDFFGMVIFVVAIRMQITGNYRYLHWLMFAGMACATVMISLLIDSLRRRFRSKDAA